MTTKEAKGFSIDDLDLVKASETSFSFEYINESTGKGTGIFISVLGSQAPKVQEWIRKELNKRRAQEALLAKRGKDTERLVEDDEEFAINAAAIRIVGWDGINQPYSHENALRLVTVNSEIRDQVFKASNELANFTKT